MISDRVGSKIGEGCRRVGATPLVVLLEHRVEPRLLLVNRRVSDRRVVDGLAARYRRGPGQHPDNAGILQGDTERIIERELPLGRFGPRVGNGSRRHIVGDAGGWQLGGITVADRPLLRHDDVLTERLISLIRTDHAATRKQKDEG